MESFYGGRQGISFVIVKRFDEIDISNNTSFAIRYFAFDRSENAFILDDNNMPIERTIDSYLLYNDWELHEKDGSLIEYKTAIGNFPIGYAEGMKQCFAQGGVTTDIVNYGEYVIIDTPNKNNLDNGKIYRRGLDYQNGLYGAEYIGQIVGQQGDSPDIIMDSFTTLVEEGGPQIFYHNDDIIPGMEVDTEGNQIFTDGVKSSWVTIKDRFGVITGCKIGFQFPYHVFEFETERVSAYTTEQLINRIDEKDHAYYSKWRISIPKGIKGDALSNLHIVNGFTKSGVNYYEDIDCTNLLGTLEDEVAIQIESDKYIDTPEKGKPIFDASSTEENKIIRYVKTEDTHREILIYKETNFDLKEEGDNSYVKIGEYNIIKNITLSDDGTLIIDYTYGDTVVYDKKIKWIDKVTFDRDNGQISLHYNTGLVEILNKEENEKIKWIDDIVLEANGKIKVTYNVDKENPYTINENNLIQWVNKINLTEDGKLEITYNTQEQPKIVNENNLIQWVNNITFNDKEGIIKVIYNNATLDENNNKIPVPLNQDAIKWITNTKLTDTGEIKVKFNIDADTVENEDGDLVNFEGHVINEDDKIRWIKHDKDKDTYGIEINTNAKEIEYDESGEEVLKDLGEGTGSQKIQVTYNTGETHEIGNPLNYIIECVVTYDPKFLPDDFKEDGVIKSDVAQEGHLLVIYSDPAYREKLKELGKCKTWQSAKLNQDHNGYFDEWYDMGIAKGDPGTVKIVTTYNTAQIVEIIVNNTPPEVIFNDIKYEGWLIGKQDSENDPVILYYYDYNIVEIDGIERAIGWKELGAVTSANTIFYPENIVQIKPSIEDAKDVKENGIILIKNKNENIINSLVHKIGSDIVNPENNFSNPYYFSSFAKYITPTLNAGVNTLEEQLLIGFNTITEEWTDEDNNIHVKTKFLKDDESSTEYYILHSIIYDSNKLNNTIFSINDSTLFFKDNKDQQFDLKNNSYYSLNLKNNNLYSLNETNNVIFNVTDILVKEDTLSFCKDGIEDNAIQIYKKQVTTQLTENGHKITKEKILTLS